MSDKPTGLPVDEEGFAELGPRGPGSVPGPQWALGGHA